MKIKKIPISDLVEFIEKLYQRQAREDLFPIPALIGEYYYILTKISLPDYDKVFIENMCFGNFGDIESMPWTAGVILRNAKGQYGITTWVRPSHTLPEDPLKVLWFDGINMRRDFFDATEWVTWGTMQMFFIYDCEDCATNILGMRELQKGCYGRDVWTAQTILAKFDPTVQATSYFSAEFEEQVKAAQKAFTLPITGVIMPDDKLIHALIGR